MNFCPNCGTVNEDNSRFCQHCGSELETASFRRPMKRLTLTQGIVIAEAVLLILLITVFFTVGSARNTPKSVAKRYFEAYEEGDWSKMYDLMDCQNSAFLQKEQFIEIMENTNHPEIMNYELLENEEFQFSKIEKTYTAQYIEQGKESNVIPISVKKQGTKTMLFFDNWKVSSAQWVAENYQIYAPVGSTVNIDGITLTDSQKLENQEAGMDCYRISAFTGKHNLQVSVPWFQLYENEVYAATEERAYVGGMELTDEGRKALKAKMQEALQSIYQAAVNKKEFSEIADLFLEDSRDECKECYDYLVEELNEDEDEVLNNAKFTNFTCQFYNEEDYESELNVEMTYHYASQYTYYYKDWGSSKLKSEIETDEGTDYMRASFRYDGTTYKISDFDINSLL